MKLKIRKGLDLNLAGAVESLDTRDADVKVFAISPDDFPGFSPKVDVAEGDAVMAGVPLMHDKNNPDLKLVAPVAGTVKAVVRGERRKVLRIEIEKSAEQPSRKFDIADSLTPDDITKILAISGLMTEMRQRPFDIVPSPSGQAPRDIFVTAIDSAPLAASPELSLGENAEYLSVAVKHLSQICPGKIYISTRHGSPIQSVEGAEMVEVEGPHPAGIAGIQAANIAPVNKGETIWTLDIVTLGRIGKLFATGYRDFGTVVAVTGPETEHPCLIKTFEGAQVEPLLSMGGINHTNAHKRIISGNVLSGIAIPADGFLRFPYRQLTVIAEGDDTTEFMGWASLTAKKPSTSPTFPGHFLKSKFSPDARLNGSRRAMIISGEYDRFIPHSIFSEYLLKAIIGKDIDAMEKLGIYEVAPEDFAVAEYADTSKLPLQRIVREGLDYMRSALE